MLERTLCMESLSIAFNAVFPVFTLILLGAFFRHREILSEITVKQLNRLLFIFLLPTLLFKNIYETEIGSVVNLKLFVFCFGGIAFFWFLTWVIVCFFIKDNRVRGAAIQGISRGNFLLFSLSLIAALVPQAYYSLASFLFAFSVSFVGLLAVITLEIFRGRKLHPLTMMKSIITNPVIISCLLGVSALLIHLKLPNQIYSVINVVSGLASPIGVIVMGAGLKIDKIKANKVVLSISVISKLIVIPFVAVVAAYLAGFKGTELLIILILFAGPTSVSSYPMAAEMDSDEDLACQIVVFTTALASFSNFAFISIIGMLGLF